MTELAASAAAPAAQPREKSWKRHIRTTREGKAFIFVTIGVGFAAFNTGNNLLFLVLGFMLSLIVLSGIMSEIVIRRIRVTRRLPGRAFAGSTTLIELSLTNNKDRSPSYSLEVEDLAEGLPTERRCYFLKIAPGAEQIAGYRRTPERRGLLRLTGFRVATRYPFGIIEKWRFVDAPAEMLVFPRLLPDEHPQLDSSSRGLDTATERAGPGSEIGGLRGYQDGDDARAIHWKRTASLGKLVVFEKHRDSSCQLTILLDNQRPDGADERWDEAFEEAISRAATVAMSNASQDQSVEVVCRGSRSPLLSPNGSCDPVLRFLALLRSVPEADGRPMLDFSRANQVLEIPVTRTVQRP